MPNYSIKKRTAGNRSMADERSDVDKRDDFLDDSLADGEVRDETIYDEIGRTPITTTTTKNALVTTQLGPCDVYPHHVKVSILGTRKVGMACAIAILMRRIASEICLIDQNAERASAEAEDVQHAGMFLGCPRVTGTSDIYKVKDSTVVVIAVCERKPGEELNVKHNLEVFKKIIPTVSKLACKAVLLVVTQPIDVMSYITWKLSKFPSSRVLGTGTLLDTSRFQDLLSQKLGLARTSISCVNIGAQGDTSVSIWSSVSVAGTKIRDINARMGEADDPEKWRDISVAVNKIDAELNRKKGETGPNCWALGFCTAEIVDAIVRNTKVVLPASTYIYTCSHGTDKDVYMSFPCVLGREGVHATVRQKLNEQEKTAVERCADNIRNVLRECGILRESTTDVEDRKVIGASETMTELKRTPDVTGNTVTFLLTKQAERLVDGHHVKVVVVGSAPKGVAVAIAILFKRLASELVLIDANEDLAKAEAEDISHAAAYLGNPRIIGTKDYSCARDAAVCVITVGSQSQEDQQPANYLDHNLKIFKDVIPNVCKFAPNSVLLILSKPVDILSYVAMKLSGFPPNRVIGLGTFLDSCRFQYFIAQKLGISPSSVQALIIGESGPASVPVWSAVAVMGMPLKEINKDIGTRADPESWGDLHTKVVDTDKELIVKKGYHSWAVGICAGEIVDAIVRNTCACFTVSTFVKGCRHGLEKDIFMSLPCVIGRNGVQSFIRLLYTPREQELMTISCRRIYESQKSILDKIE
ncbi:uncharacterized protein LOC109858050 [Pseudomyrmex gracilis]|uniref:uncharacterized protein LOC109858050 n=1 Tax=Pseudomyrmex gracilis TaxID=219809 RepID=UPI000994CF0A|nr:uncharacterized protein LOC109858050 [Pseudomyrmex gracilis]